LAPYIYGASLLSKANILWAHNLQIGGVAQKLALPDILADMTPPTRPYASQLEGGIISDSSQFTPESSLPICRYVHDVLFVETLSTTTTF
jgi:hypothetical protein